MMPAIFACSLACTVLFAVFAGPAIRKNPWVCYVPAVVLMAMYWAGAAGMLPQGLREIAFLLMQKGTLAMALFTVVMFVGVFPRGSKARLRLGAARAELSIAACLMICGHMVAYAASYVPRAFTVGFSNPFVVAGLLLAVVLAVLTAVLGVTSLSRVKARMAAAAWTRVQKLAYVVRACARDAFAECARRGHRRLARRCRVYDGVCGVCCVAYRARRGRPRSA